MYNIKKIEKKSISEEVFEQLKDNIVNQIWTSGSKLPSENDLADMFGVSRVSVRSAIQKLIALGVLESRNGEGTFVKQINAGLYLNALIPMLILGPREIFELLEFRKGIEMLSCELAAQRATSDDITMLEQIIERMKKSYDEKNINKYTIDDFNFHLAIAKISKNSVIENVLMILKDHIFKHLSEMHKILGIDASIEKHIKIFEAIKMHDPKSAAFYLEVALERTMEKVKKFEERK